MAAPNRHPTAPMPPTDPPDIAIFVATSGHSGVDRVIRNLCGEFSRRGLRVDLLHVAGHGPWLDPAPDNVRVVELGSAHVHTSLLPLVRYLRRERPRALLSDKDKVNRTALLARWLARVPTRVVVRIGTTVSKNLERRSRLQRWVQVLSMRWFYRAAATVVVPSEGAADDLARVARLPRAHIRAVPSPIITPQLEKAAEADPSHPWLGDPERPVVLGVGELCARKDFATLMWAFARLRAERPCRLLLLGEGRQRTKLEALAAELGVARDVDLPGFVDNPYAYMARADLFVLSSNCEGAPVVLMEALALGTPVVSTDCPSGPAEILEGGQHGTLVPVGDAAALAEAMTATLEQPLNRQTLQTAADRYRVEASADQYLAALGLAN